MEDSRILRRNGANVAITDWALAQYMIYNRLPLEELVKLSATEHVFVHHDPEYAADALAIKFPTTESAGYGEAGRLLHKLIKAYCSASSLARRAIMTLQDEGLEALRRFHNPSRR